MKTKVVWNHHWDSLVMPRLHQDDTSVVIDRDSMFLMVFMAHTDTP